MQEINFLTALLNPRVIDSVIYAIEAFDGYEKRKRYDDNTKLMLENALRLFEQGQLSREGLKAVIDLLPQTITLDNPNLGNLDSVLAQLLK